MKLGIYAEMQNPELYKKPPSQSNALFFRNTLSQFATGVTVITTQSKGQLIGLTANAFSSLSLDPPLIFNRRGL
jgi:flavin reductase (DIM6/NTAB) family NADH-FMN oxidoreductase RutF